MNVNPVISHNTSGSSDARIPKDKVMSYEEKSVGSTSFFKCEACPYMALAEDDIKFHLFTVHPYLAKNNGLADNIQIPCPGCTSIFDAEETLRTHLRNHHKMGIKDIKKMIKSLVQIALKDAKLKKENNVSESKPPPSPAIIKEDITKVKIPQVFEIPDLNTNNDLPRGVAYISVEELNRMSRPNFEKIDPKDIIQEASINIVYTNETCTQYVNVSKPATASTSNVVQMLSVTPDLISSVQPPTNSKTDTKLSLPQSNDIPHSHTKTPQNDAPVTNSLDSKKDLGTLCSVGGCRVRLKDDNSIAYHRKCHQNGQLVCAECFKIFPAVGSLHTHLWKAHSVDVELPTCEICGFKTYKRHRLLNVHMKCHEDIKTHICSICLKVFKNSNQLSKHKMIHTHSNVAVQCHVCQKDFNNEKKLKVHIDTVHNKVKPFKCSHCDYTAARKCELQLHLRSHTGDKPYSCNFCSHRCADHNAMRRHKRFHTQEGLYKCKHCPYTSIQSTLFAKHMLSNHSNVNSDVHCCPYCQFKSVSKEKYVTHLTSHSDKDGIQLLIEMTKGIKSNKPSWTVPSETEKDTSESLIESNDQNIDKSLKSVNEIEPIEVYDCDSLSESLSQNYNKNYCAASVQNSQSTFNNDALITDLSKEDINSDCLISESSNDMMIRRHQYTPELPMQITYNNSTNLHDFLNTTVSINQNLLQSSNTSSVAPTHSLANNIMNNFPIRLPPIPLSIPNNIMLKPVDKISVSMTKVTGPIIKPTQILPVPSSSNSPVNVTFEEGAPRKKPKISVKSNLILKGPDEVHMFHSQQKMAFRRLEDHEGFGLGPVTFNNLITTPFLQLQPESTLSESPDNIIPYPEEPLLEDSATTPVDSEINENSQIFSFNQQLNVNTMTILPPTTKQTNDPSYIKLETTIKQNTQSPSLERMCNANLLSNPALNREYKASPPLEDINKNMNEIKNEVKSDNYYNMTMSNNAANPSVIDQYLMDSMLEEQYSNQMDLTSVVLQEISDEQNDVIEIDDNSEDNKMLSRFDMNFPIESLYLMHNDFHFLESDIQSSSVQNEVGVGDINRIVIEAPVNNEKDNLDTSANDIANNDLPNLIQGGKDPMMNTSVRPTTNKINVKNIELMKN